LCANCSISPALRTTVTESVSLFDLSTSVFKVVANFSRSAASSAISCFCGSLAAAAGALACGVAGLAELGGAAAACRVAFASCAGEDCAWPLSSPALAAIAATRLPASAHNQIARLRRRKAGVAAFMRLVLFIGVCTGQACIVAGGIWGFRRCNRSCAQSRLEA
jgi:hypothetical protein